MGKKDLKKFKPKEDQPVKAKIKVKKKKESQSVKNELKGYYR